MIANLQAALDSASINKALAKANKKDTDANTATTLKTVVIAKYLSAGFGILSVIGLTLNVINLGCRSHIRTCALFSTMMSIFCCIVSHDIIITAHAVQEDKMHTRVKAINAVSTAVKAVGTVVTGVRDAITNSKTEEKVARKKTSWTTLSWGTLTKDTILAKHFFTRLGT